MSSPTPTDLSPHLKGCRMRLAASEDFNLLLAWYREHRLTALRPWREDRAKTSYEAYINQSGLIAGEQRVLDFLEGNLD